MVKGRGLALLMCIISRPILSMGCTMNLQLGEQSGVKGQGTFFLCGPNVDFSLSCCLRQKRRSMKDHKFFKYLETKNHRCLCCLPKMTFNKSQYLACLWFPKGTLLPLKFFLEGARAQRAIAPSP